MKDKKIDLKNLSLIKELDFHDGKLGEIKCDYTAHRVQIPIKLDSPKKKHIEAMMVFSGVKMFSMEILEPWGTGMYVSEVRYDCSNENNCKCFEISILLNSGDSVKIISQEIIYSELD